MTLASFRSFLGSGSSAVSTKTPYLNQWLSRRARMQLLKNRKSMKSKTMIYSSTLRRNDGHRERTL
jgi:hypothetical protein